MRYTVSGPFNMPHMPSTGVSGLDLYRCDERNFCFGEYTFGDSIRYHYTVDKKVKSNQEHEYILYLPLYNEVTYLEVGTPAENLFTSVPVRKERAEAIKALLESISALFTVRTQLRNS